MPILAVAAPAMKAFRSYKRQFQLGEQAAKAGHAQDLVVCRELLCATGLRRRSRITATICATEKAERC
jgi:hypothetical protein